MVASVGAESGVGGEAKIDWLGRGMVVTLICRSQAWQSYYSHVQQPTRTRTGEATRVTGAMGAERRTRRWRYN